MHAVDSRHVESRLLTTGNFNIRFFFLFFFHHSLLFFFFFKCKATKTKQKYVISKSSCAGEILMYSAVWYYSQSLNSKLTSLYKEGCEI